jgi:hypothetical protein
MSLHFCVFCIKKRQKIKDKRKLSSGITELSDPVFLTSLQDLEIIINLISTDFEKATVLDVTMWHFHLVNIRKKVTDVQKKLQGCEN